MSDDFSSLVEKLKSKENELKNEGLNKSKNMIDKLGNKSVKNN